MRPLRLFDVSLRTALAQAREAALSQTQVPLSTPGTLQIEARGDRRFVYRYRYDVSGKRVTDYLGPEGDAATVIRVEEAAAEIREAALLQEHSRDLRRIGYCSADNSTVLTVASLFNAGIFAGGGVLVGTHAFGVLLNDLGVRASPLPMTDDVDLARGQRIQIAALPSGGLLSLLQATGLPFHEVPTLGRGGAATSWKVRGQKLKVDLLVPAPSRSLPYRPVAIPELGAHATGLPHFRYLLEDATASILIGRDRLVPVRVPHAGRYCVHKLAVYSLRSDGAKREKDVDQAALLAAALGATHDFLLHDAVAAMDRGLRVRVRPGARRALALLEDQHPEAARVLEALT